MANFNLKGRPKGLKVRISELIIIHYTVVGHEVGLSFCLKNSEKVPLYAWENRTIVIKLFQKLEKSPTL